MPCDELVGARARIRQGSVSAVELVARAFESLDATEPAVHAYASVRREAALADAARADDARARGGSPAPLEGIPIGVKDVFATADLPTLAGTALPVGLPAGLDATVVGRLRSAGAILTGKLVTHELACGQDVPPTRNAWSTDCYPGGSSAGAGVAVAVGSAFAALGTDSGGSVRKPAALNGVVGLKPTYGRVSRAGVVPFSPSMDHVGVIARSVRDCASVLTVIAGRDERDPTSSDLPVPNFELACDRDAAGVRLGVPSTFFAPPAQPGVLEAVRTALDVLEELGARLVPIEIPALQLADAAGGIILAAEFAPSQRRWLRERPGDYTPGTRRYLQVGSLLPAAAVQAAQRARALLRRELARTMVEQRIDALVGPTVPVTAMPLAEMDIARDLPILTHCTVPANLAGLPAITVPCGFAAEDGMPVGLQIIGRPFRETGILAIAGAYERASGWQARRPPLVCGTTDNPPENDHQ